MASTDVDDARLTQLASQGDREAFRSLFERYHRPLYDFAARTVHDQDVAADVVQNTFVRAWDVLRRGEVAQNMRAWLFTVARNAALDEVRRGRHRADLDPVEAEAVLADADRAPTAPDPELNLETRELAELVWQAAASLSPRDYTLLDLHVRRGLGPDELAETLGAKRGTVYMQLSRMKEDLEEAVAFTVLVRRGRRLCPELDRLLTEQGVTPGTRLAHATRWAVRRHVRGCPACQERRRRFVSPVELFAALAPVPVSTELSDSLWNRVDAGIDALPPPTTASDGPAEWWRQAADRVSRLDPLRLALGGLVLIAAFVVGLLILRPAAPIAVDDPDDVRSTSHVIGQPSRDPRITVGWTPRRDADAYAVMWSELPVDLPPARQDLPGDAAGATSPPLGDGSWYFHLRTRSRSGTWTSTVHVGPFPIVAAAASPTAIAGAATATSTATPTATTTATATSTASATATTTPTGTTTATPTDTVTPTETATPTPTLPALVFTTPVPTPTPIPPTATPEPPTPTLPPPTATSTPAPPTATLVPPSPTPPPPTPTRAPPTPTPPPPTPTTPPATPTRTSVPPTNTATFTRTPCPPLRDASLSATTAGNVVTLAWSSTGGCDPVTGTIAARYQGDAQPYRTQAIAGRSGRLTDTPPVRCEGTFSVVYTLTLRDATGQTATATATARVNWIC